MLLNADAEGPDRNSLRDREHERRARGELAQPVASGGHDADAVDVRSSGVDLEVQALLLEEPETARHHLTELIASSEPAELHVEDGDAVDVAPRRKTGAERESAGRGEGPTEKLSPSQSAARVA
jgi:hypothetical protein